MTTSLTLRTSAAALLIALMALLIIDTPQAHAQSEVTGTITSGTAATGSTATGTVTGGSGNTLTGTVVPAPTEDDDGDGGGGGSRNRNNNNNDDDDGDVLGTSTEIPSGMGGGGDFPGVPNTGAGGGAPLMWATLLGSLLLMIAGTVALARYRPS